jgi:hypothetical protein
MMTDEEKTRMVEQYSRAEISAVELRRALGNAGLWAISAMLV